MFQRLRRGTGDPAKGRAAVVFVTVGSLAIVWSGVWLLYLWNRYSDPTGWLYIAGGIASSGLVFVVIGLAVGRIAKQAESPEDVIDTSSKQPPQSPASAPPLAQPLPRPPQLQPPRAGPSVPPVNAPQPPRHNSPEGPRSTRLDQWLDK